MTSLPSPPPQRPPAVSAVTEVTAVSDQVSATSDVTHQVYAMVGGRRIPLVKSRRCRVCRSAWVDEIETQAVLGLGWKAIWNALPEEATSGEGAITVDTIRHHLKNHTDMTRRIALSLKVQEAQERGVQLDEFEGRVLNARSAAEMVMLRGAQTLAENPDVPVSPGEMMTAARLLHTIDSNVTEGVSADAFQSMVAQMVLTAQAIMSPPQYAAWIAQIRASTPVIPTTAKEIDSSPSPS